MAWLRRFRDATFNSYMKWKLAIDYSEKKLNCKRHKNLLIFYHKVEKENVQKENLQKNSRIKP